MLSPLEFLQRLAALVPRPRLHLIRYHGVLAPNAKLRARVVPQGPAARAHVATGVAAPAECEQAEPVRARAQHIGWARLLKRVFDIDMRRCPSWGAGELKIIAAILERAAIGKIFTHLGLDPRPPPRDLKLPGHDAPYLMCFIQDDFAMRLLGVDDRNAPWDHFMPRAQNSGQALS